MSKNSKDQLESLTPNVRKRVEALLKLQSEYDVLEDEFFKKRAALEAECQELYKPLYSKRYEIVNGVVEVEGVTNEATMTEEEGKEAEGKGVPNFWVTAMKTNKVLAEEISECDEEALKYLKDIKWFNFSSGFKLEFDFDQNPLFKNSVLTKTYRMTDDERVLLEEAIGTEIEWYPGKCLTKKDVVKERKKGTNKGSKYAEPITKTVDCKSFFNFFSTPQVRENDDDTDEDDLLDDMYFFHIQMEHDYKIGSTIRDRIISHAVSWFTGEAAKKTEKDEDEGKTRKRICKG